MVKTICTELLVIGATFTGMGMALSDPDRSLVIESTAAVGSEFIAAFRPGVPVNRLFSDRRVLQFRDELMRRRAMDEAGRVHLPALAPICCSLLHQKKVRIRFLTRPMAVEYEQGKWKVTIISPAGVEVIVATNVVDTSSIGMMLRLLGKPNEEGYQPYINASLHRSEGLAVVQDLVEDGLIVYEGAIDGEVYINVSLCSEDDWSKARMRLKETWSARSQASRKWTIASVASALDIRQQSGIRTIDDQLYWLPSSGYDHPLQAYNEGLLLRNTQMDGSERL